MRTALLVIDVQNAFFGPAPRPWEADAVLERINDLCRRARAAQAPVVFIQHENPNASLGKGSQAWQLSEQLVVMATDHRIGKTTPDSFLRTALGDLVAGLGVQRLALCGYASEFCVDTTARRAAALGYSVALAADAHTTHDKPHASAADIRRHENATLPEIISFDGRIEALPASALSFSG